MSPNLRGAGLMVASMMGFVLNDACMKAMSDELPMFQAIFLRGAATSAILAAMAWYAGAFSFRLSHRDVGLVVIRSLCEVAATYFFLTALFNMPFANVSAILQALPLTVTLAGALLFGETVGWRRMSAILVGFLGVLLIVQPGAIGFSYYSVYAIIAVLVVTVRDLAARRLSKEVPSLTVAFTAATSVTVFSGLAATGVDWAPLSVASTLQLIGAVIFIIGGYLFSVMTMRVGNIGFVAPFRYTSLLGSLLLGLILFSEWPDALTLLGSAIVVATGVFTLYRERRLAVASGPVPLRTR